MSYREPVHTGGGEINTEYRPAGTAPNLLTRSGGSTHYLATAESTHGERWTDATAGDFLYVPQGGLHAFRNDSDEPASVLLLLTPGAPRVEYFEKVGQVSDWPEKERAEFFVKHDTYGTG
ncbi:cupin domain-containing protein [[Kitasatospora] papulosa]|uniref:cupin domain-containing protein n=1 Tax=[Kitasatospora] papulosa TaxID=1464011 RepID=UPI0036B18B79